MRFLTIEKVKNYVESVDGYKLISTKYDNSKTKLTLQCPKGHIFQMRYNDFQQGQRCPKCSCKCKFTYEYVKEYIEKDGYILISTRYINALKKIKIKCPRGHIFQMSFNGFKYGYRCVKCAIEDGG